MSLVARSRSPKAGARRGRKSSSIGRSTIEADVQQIVEASLEPPEEPDLRRFATIVGAELPYVQAEEDARGQAVGRLSPGGSRVFIAALWRMLHNAPGLGGMSQDRFKELLVQAHRARLLELARADFITALSDAEVAQSETRTDGATFHFVVDSPS